MSRHDRDLRFLTAVLPAGAFGLSVALASSAAEAAPAEPRQPRAEPDIDNFSVADELQAIRDAVDEAAVEIQGSHTGQIPDPDIRPAWWLNGNGNATSMLASRLAVRIASISRSVAAAHR